MMEKLLFATTAVPGLSGTVRAEEENDESLVTLVGGTAPVRLHFAVSMPPE